MLKYLFFTGDKELFIFSATFFLMGFLYLILPGYFVGKFAQRAYLRNIPGKLSLRKNNKRVIFWGGILTLALLGPIGSFIYLGLAGAIFFVPPTYIFIVFRGGFFDRIAYGGIQWRQPFFERIVGYICSAKQEKNITIPIYTQDNVMMRINFLAEYTVTEKTVTRFLSEKNPTEMVSCLDETFFHHVFNVIECAATAVGASMTQAQIIEDKPLFVSRIIHTLKERAQKINMDIVLSVGDIYTTLENPSTVIIQSS